MTVFGRMNCTSCRLSDRRGLFIAPSGSLRHMPCCCHAAMPRCLPPLPQERQLRGSSENPDFEAMRCFATAERARLGGRATSGDDDTSDAMLFSCRQMGSDSAAHAMCMAHMSKLALKMHAIAGGVKPC